MCLYRKGDLAAAVDVARTTYSSAMAIGDETSAGTALSVWTRASGGRVDAALIEAELARESSDLSTTAELRLAAALCALRDGDLDRAAEEAAKAAAVVRAGGLRQEYAAPIAAWNATIARLAVEQASAYDVAGRARLLRACAKHVRRARFWAFSYRNNAPHALREAGLAREPHGPAAHGGPAAGAERVDRGQPGRALRSGAQPAGPGPGHGRARGRYRRADRARSRPSLPSSARWSCGRPRTKRIRPCRCSTGSPPCSAWGARSRPRRRPQPSRPSSGTQR